MVIIRFTNLPVYAATGRRGQNLPSYPFLSPKSLQGQESLAASCFWARRWVWTQIRMVPPAVTAKSLLGGHCLSVGTCPFAHMPLTHSLLPFLLKSAATSTSFGFFSSILYPLLFEVFYVVYTGLELRTLLPQPPSVEWQACAAMFNSSPYSLGFPSYLPSWLRAVTCQPVSYTVSLFSLGFCFPICKVGNNASQGY